MSHEDAELQMLNTNAQMISEQLERIDSGIMEMEYVRNSLGELRLSKEGSDIFAPISNGIFVKAKLSDNDKLLVNVGNGIVAEKSVEDTQSLILARISEMTEAREKLVSQMQKLEERLIKIGEK